MLDLSIILKCAVVFALSNYPAAQRNAPPDQQTVVYGTNQMPNFVHEEFLKFNDDPEASAAFLQAFDSGYRAGLEGRGGVLDIFEPTRTASAMTLGYFSGQTCGSEWQRREQMRKREEALKNK